MQSVLSSRSSAGTPSAGFPSTSAPRDSRGHRAVSSRAARQLGLARVRVLAMSTIFAVILSIFGVGMPAHANPFTETLMRNELNIVHIADSEGNVPAMSMYDTVNDAHYAPSTTLLHVPDSTNKRAPFFTDDIYGFTVDNGTSASFLHKRFFAFHAPILSGDTYDKARLTLTSSGPANARILLYTADEVTAPTGVTTSGNLELGATSTIDLTEGQTITPWWVFTQPGTHVINVRAELSSSTSDTKAHVEQTYTIHAGVGEADTSNLVPLAFQDENPGDGDEQDGTPSTGTSGTSLTELFDHLPVGTTTADKLLEPIASFPEDSEAPGTDAPDTDGPDSGDEEGTTPGAESSGNGNGAGTGTADGNGEGDEGSTGPVSTTPVFTDDSNPNKCLPQGVKTVIDNGHVDMFHLVATNNGVTLNLKEDVTGHGVTHAPESVLLRAKEASFITIPSGGAPAGVPTKAYVLPQTQDRGRGLLWAGWDTMDARAAGFEKAKFNVSYTGPQDGRIYLWLAGVFSGFESRLKGGAFELDPKGAVIGQDYPAHTHGNWAFSKPGRYTLTVSADLESADGAKKVTTNSATYIIDVGAVECPSLSISTSTVPRDGKVEFTASNLLAGSDVVFEVHSDPVALPAVKVDAAGVARATWTVPADFPLGKHTVRVQGYPQLAVPLTVTDKVAQTLANGDGSQSGTNGASGGSDTIKNAPINRDEACVPTTITREATEEEAKQLAAGGQAGSAAARNAGGVNTARTVVTFAVGQGGGNANDGHFDLGPGIENNTVVAKVKDDRRQPAKWVDPQSLTFGVGDAARIQAPEALSFVAQTGSQVWMIPATQIPGVPWVGMNSQREEIVNGTNGGVTFTLEKVSGPGKVAVFSSGSFGSGVGEKVFNGAGSSYVLPANTHAHFNWVFTAPGTYKLTIAMKVNPKGGTLQGSASAGGGLTLAGDEKGPNGRPMVKETVGRTASGAECSLAKTGASSALFVGYSAVLLMFGAGVVVARHVTRRRGTAALPASAGGAGQ